MALIRPVEDADWPQVHDIVVEVATAGETYAMDVPASPTDTRDFWSGDHVVVAVDGDTRARLGQDGANRPAQGSHVGTASFMVGSVARGRGIGRALGEYVVDWHRANGFRAIQFNAVVSTNTAAIRLWQSLGFEIVGTVPGAFRLPDSSYADLHVMYLDLRAAVNIAEIRRYPVKAMAGESLDSVLVEGRGLVGDRRFAVLDDDGRMATGKDSRRFRRRDAIFDFRATTVARRAGRGPRRKLDGRRPRARRGTQRADGSAGAGARRRATSVLRRLPGLARRHRVAGVVPHPPWRRRGRTPAPDQSHRRRPPSRSSRRRGSAR